MPRSVSLRVGSLPGSGPVGENIAGGIADSLGLTDQITAEWVRAGGWVYGPLTSYKPDSSTTGFRPGAPPRPNQAGDLVITAPGTYKDLTLAGRLQVRTAGPVILDNFEVVGQASVPSGTTTSRSALVSFEHISVDNVLFTDSVVHPQTPSVYWGDGIKGHHHTSRRIDVYGTTDGIGVMNTDGAADKTNASVRLEGNYVHDLGWHYDELQGDKITHNDCLQWHGGSHGWIIGNNFQGFVNQAYSTQWPHPWATSGLQVTGSVLGFMQIVAAINDIHVTDNWLGGGGYGGQVYGDIRTFGAQTFGEVKRNKHARTAHPISGVQYNMRFQTGIVVDSPTSGADADVFEDNGAVVPMIRF